MRRAFAGWLCSSCLVFGCSGGDFGVGASGEDTGVSTDGGDTDIPPPDSPPLDSPPLDSRPPDDGSPDSNLGDATPGDATSGDAISIDGTPTDTGCTLVGVDAVDVYVNKNSTAPSMGTASCPFKTIREASTMGPPSTTRTIHVAGGTPTVEYAENGLVDLGSNVTLLGDGASRVKIYCNSSCTTGGGSSWIGSVNLQGGATLDGVTVVSGTLAAHAISSAGVLVGTAPKIKNTIARDAKNHGIYSQGNLDIGPNVQATLNVGNGVMGTGGSGSGTAALVRVSGTGNSFDGNGNCGLQIVGFSRLDFGGGTASNNGANGIAFGSYATAAHVVTELTAKNNGVNGILASGGSASLRLRNSVLLANKSFGLRFTFNYATDAYVPPINSLDIGTSGGSPGNNTFGVGSPTSDRNVKGSMCLDQSPGTGTVAAHTDKFATCAPLQVSATGCDSLPTTGTGYVDIYYVIKPVKGGPDPVSVSSCSVGP